MELVFAAAVIFVVLVAIVKAREILKEKQKMKEWHRKRRKEQEKGREKWKEICEEWENGKGIKNAAAGTFLVISNIFAPEIIKTEGNDEGRSSDVRSYGFK